MYERMKHKHTEALNIYMEKTILILRMKEEKQIIDIIARGRWANNRQNIMMIFYMKIINIKRNMFFGFIFGINL